MNNLEKLKRIKNLMEIFQNNEDLNEYIEVLIEIEKEY
jgi:hypothetical protein